MKPKVSAILSTYNAEAFIERCVRNLLLQTLGPKLEIIIINSGSEQGEAKILAPYRTRYSNIRYIETERETIYAAWNRGIREAQGEYLINTNTDDLSYPQAFAHMAARLDAQPEVALLYTDYYVTGNANDTIVEPPPAHWHVIPAPEYSHKKLLLQCFCGPRPMWRRSLHQQLGYFDERLRYAGDYEFWLRIAEHYVMQAENVPLHLYYDNKEGLWWSLRSTDEELEVRLKYLAKGKK